MLNVKLLVHHVTSTLQKLQNQNVALKRIDDPSGHAVFGSSIAGIAGSRPASGKDMSVVSVVCGEVGVFASY